MILESIVTTVDSQGIVNVAPMGPQIDDASFSAITLKPFRSSRTYANLMETGTAVVHVTDDVELIARAAIGQIDASGLTIPMLQSWHRLADCCRWFAVEVVDWQDDPLRPQARCRIVHQGEQRPMFGFNRGKHAVIEAAILATRVDMLGREEVQRQMRDFAVWVQKTGGAAERRAWALLESFVDG